MPRFKVYQHFDVCLNVEVEAATEDEACTKGQSLIATLDNRLYTDAIEPGEVWVEEMK